MINYYCDIAPWSMTLTFHKRHIFIMIHHPSKYEDDVLHGSAVLVYTPYCVAYVRTSALLYQRATGLQRDNKSTAKPLNGFSSCDLDLWPLTFSFLHTIVYCPSKYEQETLYGSAVIVYNDIF